MSTIRADNFGPSAAGISSGSCDVETHIYYGNTFEAQYVLFSIHGDLA